MATLQTYGNPKQAPEYARHRTGVTALDGAAAIADRGRGINMAHQTHAHIQVVPSGAANPTIEVLWWSEEASQFIPEHTPLVKAGVGVAKPYEFTVEARGRILFVKVTAGAVGSVEILVSGFNVERV